MAFFTSSIFIPNLAERNPSMIAHGFVFLMFPSVASSSFFEEKVSIPVVKMAIVPTKNNFKKIMIHKSVNPRFDPESLEIKTYYKYCQ